MSNFTQTPTSITDIVEKFQKGTLTIDSSYQRRSIWSEKDKVALIETILLDLVIPELFFWQAEINSKTGKTITHIVDGQQRIKAIVQFTEDEYELKEKFLREKQPNPNWVNRKFSSLPEEDKKRIWNYKLAVIDIDSRVKRDEIVNMFRRLNLTDYNLNDQEKRNTNFGEFAVLAKELANDQFWRKSKRDSLFTAKEVQRMKDIEFCATIILLWRNGIGETPQKILNSAYEEFATKYKDAENDKKALSKAMDIVNKFINKETIKFIQKKSQLYTLFSLVFYTFRENKKLTQQQIDQFRQFVKLYSNFKNEFNLPLSATEEEKSLYELLKKYKLASSEGLKKHTNRMIRFNVLKSFLYELSSEQIVSQETLLTQMVSKPNNK
ncbi:MAG: DUF262 domain-containing protein [Planctomycetaceae bacterium]|jgi:hypothetical protein|nr:DUF262 domain-containing protein [Planctomycetaceae bacterium]